MKNLIIRKGLESESINKVFSKNLYSITEPKYIHPFIITHYRVLLRTYIDDIISTNA